MKYKVLSQFLKTGAKFDANAKKAVKSGVDHYNSRSLIAKNPKQILDYSFSPDGTTLELILESEEKLPMPSTNVNSVEELVDVLDYCAFYHIEEMKISSAIFKI